MYISFMNSICRTSRGFIRVAFFFFALSARLSGAVDSGTGPSSEAPGIPASTYGADSAVTHHSIDAEKTALSDNQASLLRTVGDTVRARGNDTDSLSSRSQAPFALFSGKSNAPRFPAAPDEKPFHKKSEGFIDNTIPLPLAVPRLSGKFFIRLLVVLLFFVMVGCFILYLKNRAEQTTFVTKTRLSIMDKEVQKACRYIEKNYVDNGLCVDSICAALITGKAFLQALFKQELGIAVEEFITHVRINRARMLLDNKPDLSAAGVAAETGFVSVDEFSSAFTGIIGVSFEGYRENQARHAP
jgi:AraC-like DNA-binding protein